MTKENDRPVFSEMDEEILSLAPPSWRWLFWLAMLGLAVFLLYVLRGALLPFVSGAAVAYFLNPVVEWLERRGLSRPVATTVVTGLIGIGFILVLLVLIPLIHNQIINFIDVFPDMVTSLQHRLEPVWARVKDFVPLEGLKDLPSDTSGFLKQGIHWGSNLGREILSSTLAFFSLLSVIVIAPVVAFYLLRDWKRLIMAIDSWLPRAYAPGIRSFFVEVDTTLAGFIRGQSTLCLIQAVYYAIGLSVLGVYPGLLVGLVSGFLSFIPYVGSIGGLVAGLALAFVQFDEMWRVIAVAGLFSFGQFIEGNFLSPLLVGSRVGLHPVWVIFSLLAGGVLFGFVGILLAVPVAAVIGVLVRHLLAQYLRSRYYKKGVDSSTESDA